MAISYEQETAFHIFSPQGRAEIFPDVYYPRQTSGADFQMNAFATDYRQEVITHWLPVDKGGQDSDSRVSSSRKAVSRSRNGGR